MMVTMGLLDWQMLYSGIWWFTNGYGAAGRGGRWGRLTGFAALGLPILLVANYTVHTSSSHLDQSGKRRTVEPTRQKAEEQVGPARLGFQPLRGVGQTNRCKYVQNIW